jgi:hypothetical protein
LKLKMPKKTTSARKPYKAKPHKKAYLKRKTKKYARKAVAKATGFSSLHPFAAAQINPFSQKAYGARIPDSNTAPSAAFQTYDEYNLPTIGTNANAAALNVMLPVTYVMPTGTLTLNGWSWGSGYGTQGSGFSSASSSKLSAVEANYSAIRPVAHGIRITCPLSLLNATGYLHVCLYADSIFGDTTWSYPTSISQMTSLPGYVRMTLAELCTKPLIYVNRFLSQDAFTYRDPSDSAETQVVSGTAVKTVNTAAVPYSWMSIMVAVEGAPSGGSSPGIVAVVIQSLIHWEGTMIAGGLDQQKKPEKDNPPVLSSTTNTVTNLPPAFVESSTSTRESQGSTLINNNMQQLAVPSTSGNYCDADDVEMM